jgi:hypothetical protein
MSLTEFHHFHSEAIFMVITFIREKERRPTRCAKRGGGSEKAKQRWENGKEKGGQGKKIVREKEDVPPSPRQPGEHTHDESP